MRLGIFRGLKDRLDRLLGRGVVDEQLFEELEEALLLSDVPIRVCDELLQSLRKAVKEERIEAPEQLRTKLQSFIAARLHDDASALAVAPSSPTVYLFLGVNGAGKTTSIAKLARMLGKRGKSVILAAGDTFRAAAIEQLELWAQRTGVQIVKGQPGGDPGAVVFDAITAAKARGIDFVLADTAGRQHTKSSLMNELQKIVRVAEKALGRAPDELLLVLDGNAGQNAVRQAEEFARFAGVTGVVMTKLDGTAKGGALLGVRDQLGIPIKLIGTGETADDIELFDANNFAAELVNS
ncbi:MAG: signal recognition particle-docking protein FtsY [Fimbriimonadales bacterium]